MDITGKMATPEGRDTMIRVAFGIAFVIIIVLVGMGIHGISKTFREEHRQCKAMTKDGDFGDKEKT